MYHKKFQKIMAGIIAGILILAMLITCVIGGLNLMV